MVAPPMMPGGGIPPELLAQLMGGGGAAPAPPMPLPGMMPPGAMPPDPAMMGPMGAPPGGMPMPPPGMGPPMPPGPGGMGMPPMPPGMGMGPPPMPPGMVPPGIAGPLGQPPTSPDMFAGTPPIDPLAMVLLNPKLLAALQGGKEPELKREAWQRPPKPTEGQISAKCQEDRNRLIALNRRFEDQLARIDFEAFGVFEGWDADAEQPYRSTAIAQDDQMIANIVGSIEPAFDSPRRRTFDADEAQAKEDFVAWLHHQHKRQHALRGNGDLDIEISKTITRYGRICASATCAFDHGPGQPPFKMRLHDPGVVYPTYAGDRGMICATLIYRQRLGDFIGDHDGNGDEIRKKLLGSERAKERQLSGKSALYEWDTEGEVYEYWDCRYCGLLWDGKLVKIYEHNYGRPPFVYVLAPYGPPSYTRTPTSNSVVYQAGVALSPVEADFARRGQSHHHMQFIPHAQREAVLGKLTTSVAMWKQEPIYVAQDDMTYGKKPKISRAGGSVNLLRAEHEQMLPPPDPPTPPALGPLLAANAEELGRGALGPQEYGMTPSAQQSGYSIAGLSERGAKKLIPVIRTKETFHSLFGELQLQLYGEFGHKMGDDGARGRYEFPKMERDPRPTAETTWILTPDMIQRTGWELKCRLVETPDITTLNAMANAFGQLRQQGTISRREQIMLQGLPGSRNPERTMKEIDLEQIKEMPEKKLADLLKYVVEEEGDPALADFIMAQYVQGKQKQMAEQGQGGPPGMPPGGPSGGPPPGSMPPGGPGRPMPPRGTPGMSMPAQGIQTGRMGGRPMGPPPPPGYPPGVEP